MKMQVMLSLTIEEAKKLKTLSYKTNLTKSHIVGRLISECYLKNTKNLKLDEIKNDNENGYILNT